MEILNQLLSSPLSVIVWTFVLAIIPGLAWIGIYIWRYRKLSIPVGISIGVFLLSLFSVVPSAFFERIILVRLSPTTQMFLAGQVQTLSTAEMFIAFALAFLIVAPIEELFKYLCIGIIAYRSKKFVRPIDGVFMGILAGLGFAIIENIVYFFPLIYYQQVPVLIGSFILRFFISTVAHTIYTGIAGYFLAKAKLFPLQRKKYFVLSLLIPILLHGFFNFFLFTKVSYYAIFLVIIALVLVFRLAYQRSNMEVRYRRGQAIDKPYFKDTEFSEQKFKTEKKFQTGDDHTNQEVYDVCPYCYASNPEKKPHCLQCNKSLYKG